MLHRQLLNATEVLQRIENEPPIEALQVIAENVPDLIFSDLFELHTIFSYEIPNGIFTTPEFATECLHRLKTLAEACRTILDHYKWQLTDIGKKRKFAGKPYNYTLDAVINTVERYLCEIEPREYHELEEISYRYRRPTHRAGYIFGCIDLDLGDMGVIDRDEIRVQAMKEVARLSRPFFKTGGRR